MAKQIDVVSRELISIYTSHKRREILMEKSGKEPTEQEMKDHKEMMPKVCDYIHIAPTGVESGGRRNVDFSLKDLRESRDHAKKYRMKNFHITEIESIPSKSIIGYSFGIDLIKRKKDIVKIADQTGVFKIKFSDGSIFMYAKWISGGGKAKDVEGLFAAEQIAWYKFTKLMTRERKRVSKPKSGIYRVNSDPGGSIFYSDLEVPSSPVVHQETKNLVNDLEYYFANTKKFMRFNRPGTRKILMVGEPGTGKSSLCMKLAIKYSHDTCIVFSTSIEALAGHLASCAKHSMRTIGFLEDAENTIRPGSSGVLNFLDGVDQPRNVAGSYIVMTTNNPQQLEDRITKRPGRIDKIIKFGAVEGVYALKVAELYFDEIMDKGFKIDKASKSDKNNMHKVVNGMTGAQIKNLAETTAMHVASNPKIKKITFKVIEDVKKHIQETLKEVDKYADAESLNKVNNKPMGFETQIEDFFVETLVGDSGDMAF